MKYPFLAIGVIALCGSIAFSQSPAEEVVIEKLRKGPDTIGALETVLKEADQFSALALFIGAKVAIEKNRLEDSGFLFYSAQLRYRFDLERFPPKGTGGNSPFQLYAALSNNIGMKINPAIMAEPKVFAKALNRVKKWLPKVPEEYDPGYDYLKRMSEKHATKATNANRTEFINRMGDLSLLLNDPGYFAAFRIFQEYNFSTDDNAPTVEAYENATETMKRVEKTKGLQGFFGEEEPRKTAGRGYKKVDGEWHYYGRVIKGVHSETFHLISGTEFAKDRSQVYVNGHVVSGADPQTFTVIKGPYGKDKAKVYCGTVAMNVHDIDAFEVVSWEGMWSETLEKKQFIFDYGKSFETLKISEESPAVTGYAVGRDGVAYYSGPARIEGADYASFRAGSMGGGVDKNREYAGPFPVESWPQRRKEILWAD